VKIAFIRNEYDPYGGAERFTQTLTDSFAERGAEVHIFARKWIESDTPNIRFHRIRSFGSPSLLRHASFVYMSAKAVRKEKFDLVQSNERTLCQDIYRAGDGVHARWLEIRATYESFLKRVSLRLNPFHRYILRLERRLFEHPDLKAVIVNSDMVRREITSRFRISDEHIHTIYNGVDLKDFHPQHKAAVGKPFRKECHISDSTPLVLFVGSGFERKGLSTLIRGMSMAGGDAKLWVVGKGKSDSYKKLADQLCFTARVTFWGPQKNVMPFYAAADIFALPTWYDPFPTVVLEALASGLPVITTAQCGAAEVIRRGREGFILSSPQAIPELAGYLTKLYHPSQRGVMSLNARKKAEEFPTERTVRELDELYQKVINMKSIS